MDYYQNKSIQYLTINQAIKKLEYFCAYQERSHQEVINKLFSLKVPFDQHDQIIVHLIENNFLNEERFALSFARGKHRINGWGKNRIVSELKFRNISNYLIKKALREIDDQMYLKTLHDIAYARWSSINETSVEKKKLKLQGFLHRKGYEYDLINEILLDLVKNDK
ncbi:regulatory protein RecX [Myroides sp. LJL119]